MSEFEAEVKKAEKELEQSLIPVNPDQAEGQNSFLDDEFLGDLKMQAQEYGQKLQDAAAKAKDFAGEKFAHVATNSMGELLMATPALSDGVMYVRSAASLFAIGKK